MWFHKAGFISLSSIFPSSVPISWGYFCISTFIFYSHLSLIIFGRDIFFRMGINAIAIRCFARTGNCWCGPEWEKISEKSPLKFRMRLQPPMGLQLCVFKCPIALRVGKFGEILEAQCSFDAHLYRFQCRFIKGEVSIVSQLFHFILESTIQPPNFLINFTTSGRWRLAEAFVEESFLRLWLTFL